MHDILTGSQADGRAFTGGEDMTCGNWTKSGADGGAMLGHHDRTGLDESAAAKSWNTSHRSRGGCSQEALRGTEALDCSTASRQIEPIGKDPGFGLLWRTGACTHAHGGGKIPIALFMERSALRHGAPLHRSIKAGPSGTPPTDTVQ
jgi:hypothetical protein